MQVTDDMRVTNGGGCASEGEMIEVAEVPVEDSLKFMWNRNIEKPIGMGFALLWYFLNKGKSWPGKSK